MAFKLQLQPAYRNPQSCQSQHVRSMCNAHIVHEIMHMCVMSGMQAEAEVLCRQKEAAAANRKDSKLKAVVISEAWDKKAGKYNAPSVPFPFDSKATYEQSMRTPMGRVFNTTAAHRQDIVFCLSETAQPAHGHLCTALSTRLLISLVSKCVLGMVGSSNTCLAAVTVSCW